MSLRSSVLRGAACRRKLDLPFRLLDPLDEHVDRITEAECAAATPADQSRTELVQLEVVALEPPRREVALEHVAEADEETGADRADDLALVGLLPPPLEQLRLEEPGEAELVGEVFDLGSLPF